jgi:hypothetical protein
MSDADQESDGKWCCDGGYGGAGEERLFREV